MPRVKKKTEEVVNCTRTLEEAIGLEDKSVPIRIEPSNKVDHPDHYNKNGIEVMDCIEAWLGLEGAKNFCIGNCIKYLARARYKANTAVDLQKAQWYLNWVLNKTAVSETDNK